MSVPPFFLPYACCCLLLAAKLGYDGAMTWTAHSGGERMSAASIRGQQTGGFAIGRWLSLTLSVVWLVAMSTTSMAQLDLNAVRSLVTENLQRPMGMLGPLPVAADDVNVVVADNGFVVELVNAHVLGAPLTTFSLEIAAVDDQLLRVESGSIRGSENVSVDRWAWEGQWDLRRKTYAELNYQLLGARVDNGSDRVDLNRLHFSVVPSNERKVGPVSRTDWEIDGLQIMLRNGERWSLAAEAIDWQHTAEPGRPSLYAQLDQQLSQWTALQQAGRFAVQAEGPVIDQLPDLFGLATRWAADTFRAPALEQSQARIKGLQVQLRPIGIKVSTKELNYRAGSEGFGDDIQTTPLSLRAQEVSIDRREDQLLIDEAQLGLTVQNLQPAVWARAFQRLFQPPSPGDTWAFVPDLLTFYDGLSIVGQMDDVQLSLPDRHVIFSIDNASGALALHNMMADGASIDLSGGWQGADVVSTADVPVGQVPDPVVLNGRVLRFDPLTQGMIPREGKAKITIEGLPLGNVRQSLTYQPRMASLLDRRAIIREAATAGLVLITPFLITPPQVSLMDTSIEGNDYAVSAEASLAINPVLPPFYAVGAADVTVVGFDRLTDVAEQVRASADPAGTELDQDLWDWADRVLNRWLTLFLSHADAQTASKHQYRFEATALGQLLLNDHTLYAPQ